MSQYNERVNFIEETGVFFENLGMTRMAGRIMGHLMITDKEMVSFDELTQVLQASKSSISNNLKALTQTTFIKPVTRPGDRKTYYMLTPDMDWELYFEKRIQILQAMNQLFKKGLDLRVNKKDKPAQWLMEAIDFYDWLIKEFPALIERWKKEKKEAG